MMRSKRLYFALFVILIGVSLMPMLTIAQDAPFATATPIPIEGADTDDSAAPGLDVAPPPVATESVEPNTTSDATAATQIIPSGPVCPTLIQDSFTATEFVCESISTGDACIGNGTVEASFGAANTGASFASPGDVIGLTSLEEVRLRSTSTASGAWTVVSARIELNSTDGSIPVGVPLVMYGDVTFSDTGQIASGTARNATVIAGSGLNVRRSPGNDGVLIWQLGAGEQVLVTGITADKQWVRLQIPNRFTGTGWAYAPYLEVDGGAETLAIVTASSPAPDLAPPEFGPMQSVELLTANTSPDCNTIDSGILLQSPNGLPDRVKILINDVDIRMNGTVHIQAQADSALTINVLEGVARVTANGEGVRVDVGNRATVTLDSNLQPTSTPQLSAITLSDFVELPTRLLPRQILLGTAPTAPDDTTDAQPTQAVGFGTPAPTNTPETCSLTNGAEVRNMRTGPSTDYPVSRVLQANETVIGSGQLNVGGFVWYQTTEGGWLRFDTVTASTSCGALPVVEAPAVPPTPVATATPLVTAGLTSSLLGEVACPGGRETTSGTSDGRDFSIALGGTWTVQAGTSVTFTVQGGQLRPEFGDYIQIVGDGGTVLAQSNNGTQLQVTFSETRNFVARFSAANGDLVVMEVVCNGAG